MGTQAPSICRGIQSIWCQREYLRPWSAALLLLAWPLRSSEPFLPGGWRRGLFHGHLSFLPLLPAGMATPPDHCVAPVGVPAVAVAPSTSRKRAPLPDSYSCGRVSCPHPTGMAAGSGCEVTAFCIHGSTQGTCQTSADRNCCPFNQGRTALPSDPSPRGPQLPHALGTQDCVLPSALEPLSVPNATL